MEYTLTSAQANKLLKKLIEEKNLIIDNENQTSFFNASLNEDIESVRPEYNYEKTSKALDLYDKKIRDLKHAINMFNCSTIIKNSNMSIDQVLIYIPQLTEKKNRLFVMQNTLPKKRSDISGTSNSAIIDYKYTNYDVKKVKEDYKKVSDELRKIQLELDEINNTVKFTLKLDD